MNIREINIKFSTEDQRLAYIEQMKWPDGVVRCPTCGDGSSVSEAKARSAVPPAGVEVSCIGPRKVQDLRPSLELWRDHALYCGISRKMVYTALPAAPEIVPSFRAHWLLVGACMEVGA